MSFMGGSAFAMARDIAEGYILLNAAVLRRMVSVELKQLRFELDRILMTLRGEQIPQDQMAQLQARNRKISRLNSAVSMINGQLLAK
jgi:hypothetical protein